jgi:hypothetical protein
MPKKKRAKKVRTKKADGFFKKIGGKLKTHTHPLPLCSGSTHDTECDSLNKELTCKQVSIRGKKFALCVHLR